MVHTEDIRHGYKIDLDLKVHRIILRNTYGIVLAIGNT